MFSVVHTMISKMHFVYFSPFEQADWLITRLKRSVIVITGHTLDEHVPMVKLFLIIIFSRGTIIFVQASFISLFFEIILLNHNSNALSDFL